MFGGSKIFIGGDHTGVTDNGRMKPITGIRFITGDESEIFVGDESGTVLEQECPHATMAMAEAALQRLKGYEYQMATADEAGLDPAAEPGDGITAGGVYFALSRVSDDGGGYPTVEASGEAEMEDEYPTHGDGPLTRYLKREIKGAYTVIERTDSSIRLLVEDTEKGLKTTLEETASGLRADFEAADTELGRRTTTIEATIDGITVSGEGGTTYIKPGAIQADSITGSMIAANTITADDIQAGSITASCLNFAVYDQAQTNAQITSQIAALKNGLELTVENNKTGTAATLRLMDGSIELDSANINLTGLVTIDALQTSGGGVTINGDNITAGTIKGEYIDGKNLNIADKFIVDDYGNITIQNCSITLQDSSVDSDMLANDAVTEYKIADGAVKADKIDARGLSIGPEGGPAQFWVEQNGNVHIGGSVSIGGTISWSQVTGTGDLTDDISTAKSDASSAKTDASTANTDLKALAKGNYTKAGVAGDTFISGKVISSAEIRGGTFKNLDGTGQFKVETDKWSVDFAIGTDSSNPLIRIAASKTGSEACALTSSRLGVMGMKGGGTIQMDGTNVLTFFNTGGVTVGGGTWDFTKVSVKLPSSLNVTAKFG